MKSQVPGQRWGPQLKDGIIFYMFTIAQLGGGGGVDCGVLSIGEIMINREKLNKPREKPTPMPLHSLQISNKVF
jgi:hypothetical protein